MSFKIQITFNAMETDNVSCCKSSCRTLECSEPIKSSTKPMNQSKEIPRSLSMKSDYVPVVYPLHFRVLSSES